jgi:HEAT repeat protein
VRLRVRWTRRRTVAAVTAAVLLLAAGFVEREQSYVRSLPREVRGRMPWHCRIPWGLDPDVRAGIEGLYSRSARERLQAAHDLGCMGPDAAPAVPHLVALLADEVPDGWNPRPKSTPAPERAPFWDSCKDVPVLGAVVQFFSWAPEPSEEKKLYVSGRACRALAEIGPAAVEPLIRALHDPDVLVRMHAALALGNIADERAIDPLGAVLEKREGDGWQAAASALAQFRNERAAKHLAAAFMRIYRDDEPAACLMAAQALACMGPAGLPPLIEGAKAGPFPRYLSVVSLGKYLKAREGSTGPDVRQAAETLAAALADPDGDTARAAAEGLRLNEPFVVDALVSALKHPSLDVRKAALDSLAEIGGPRAADAHAALLADPEIGPKAAINLARMGDRRALPYLRRTLDDPSGGGHEGELWAIGYIHDPEATDILLDVMAHTPNLRTCEAAASAFRSTKDSRALPILEAAARRWSGSVTISEALAFCRTDPDDVRSMKERSAAGRAAAVPGWEKSLSDPRLSQRTDAARDLLLTGTPEALAALRQTYSIHDAQFIDYFCFTFYIADPMPGTDAILDVLAGHKDPQVRRAAALCLAVNKDPRVVPALRTAAADVCPSVRQAAWCALEKLTGQTRPASVPTVWLNMAYMPMIILPNMKAEAPYGRDPEWGDEW